MKVTIIILLICILVLGCVALIDKVSAVDAGCSGIEDDTAQLNIGEGYSPYVQLCYGLSFS